MDGNVIFCDVPTMEVFENGCLYWTLQYELPASGASEVGFIMH